MAMNEQIGTNYKGGPGRKSKGAREPILTRLRKSLAMDIKSDADARNVTYSDYLWHMAEWVHSDPDRLAAFEGLLPARTFPKSQQEALPFPAHGDMAESA